MPIKNNNKILVVGAGSIGQRHIKNLKTLGVEHIGVVDPVLGLPSYSLKEALKEKWDAVFICSPSSTHLKIALEVAVTKTPMFIEKPLGCNLENLPEMQKMAKNIKPIMVGYNMDFHPQFKKVKSVIKRKSLGKILGIRVEFGYYLPDWRPSSDYSKGYSAKKDLGGGILLDDIHEINLIYNLFGPIKKVFGVTARIGNLKIDTEDYVEATVWFENGIIGQVHMDYLQRSYSRNLKIIGEKGTLIWDLSESKIELYTVISKQWKIVDKIAKFDWNETYLAEIKEFLSCLKAKKNPESDFQRGIETLKIALAIKQSSVSNKTANL